jgi:DNA-binding transcriptional MerR regulator
MELETKPLLSIGPFAKITGLTVKALRHYDRMGLLAPAHVDDSSGYRYYALAQARTAESIRKLRALEVPLDEIRTLLTCSADELRERLAVHRARLEGRAVETRRILAELGRIIDGKESLVPETSEIEVRRALEVREVPEQRVVSVHDRASEATIGQVIPQAIDRVHGFLASHGVEPAGAPICITSPWDDAGEMELDTGWPVGVDVETEPPFEALTLPATRALVMRHVGPYQELHTSYRLMCETMEEQGLTPAGPVREVYVTNPEEVPDPADYVTEIVWPIGPEGALKR